MSPSVKDAPLTARYFHMFFRIFFFLSPTDERHRRFQAEKCAGKHVKAPNLESQKGRIFSRYLYHRPGHMGRKRHRGK